MKFADLKSDLDSPVSISAFGNVLCQSFATPATASSVSGISDAPSLLSADCSANTSFSDVPDYVSKSRPLSQQSSCASLRSSSSHAQVARQNPRRTTARTACPPLLVRQSERKHNFVDNLVDSSTQIVEAIWPTSSVFRREDSSHSSVLPLRTFIQETLRRSRTSYSTLQVALYYLVLIKDHLPDRDFTMEQREDCHAIRALQCGRRMFLAALILASKYLQDRNYSARAWSKISGLATHEINQNEMAFLVAVNWRLHVTEEVYNRWTDCVMTYTPSQPPPPPGCGLALAEYEYQCEDFRRIILALSSNLDNLDDVLTLGAISRAPSLSPRSVSPRSVLAAAQDTFAGHVLPRARIPSTPSTMEPPPSPVLSAMRLPSFFRRQSTPRLGSQHSGALEPAPVPANKFLHTERRSSMSLAMSAACSAPMEKWPTTPSPFHAAMMRRSSLANSISTPSSPESMVSDTSRTSRSSSISSASSLNSAPYTKLDVLARCRYAKMCGERYAMRPSIASVPEKFQNLMASPVSYFGADSSDTRRMSLDEVSAKTICDVDDATNDAAQALKDLHENWRSSRSTQHMATSAPQLGSKRSRPVSGDLGLQDNVRELLREHSNTDKSYQAPLPRPPVLDGRKRICCSAEAAQYAIPPMDPAAGGCGAPGMWTGVLN